MKALIDTCVLFPTVLREIVLEVAGTGYFDPLWSERILEEWRRTGMKHGEGDIAVLEIAALERRFPNALVDIQAETQSMVTLPDPDDDHVLAAAIDGEADELITLNLKDFPTNTLSSYGIIRRDPDGFLLEAWFSDNAMVEACVARVIERAGRHGIDVTNPRALLKRARLPRLAKALYAS